MRLWEQGIDRPALRLLLVHTEGQVSGLWARECITCISRDVSTRRESLIWVFHVFGPSNDVFQYLCRLFLSPQMWKQGDTRSRIRGQIGKRCLETIAHHAVDSPNCQNERLKKGYSNSMKGACDPSKRTMRQKSPAVLPLMSSACTLFHCRTQSLLHDDLSEDAVTLTNLSLHLLFIHSESRSLHAVCFPVWFWTTPHWT